MNQINYIKLSLVLICSLSCLISFSQPLSFESKGMCGGGATTQPSISPFNDQLYFVTSDMSPILKTENAGADWEVIPFYELTGSGQHTKVEFTSDSNILYTFGYTGYPNPKEPLKSTDGGLTWSVLPSDPTNGYVYQLYADPGSTDRILMCDYRTVYISLDGGTTFSTAFTPSTNSIYIGGVFWDSSDIYIASNNVDSTGAAILWVSNDSGLTFNPEPINGDFPLDQYFRYMEGVKVNGQVKLYAITMHSSFGGLNYSEYWGPTRKVLRLEYGNGTWESLDSNGLNLASGGGAVHPNIISTCTSEPNVVYLGCFHAPGMEVYKSIDGGDTWVQRLDCNNTNQNPNISTGWIGAGSSYYNWWWSGPVIGMDVSNSNSDIVVITDYMSSHHSRDGGLSWESLYTKPSELNPSGSNTPDDLAYESNGLEITTCWDMHWMSPIDLFIGYSDVQGFISDDGGDSWSSDYTYPTRYNTTYTIVPAETGNKIYACVSDKHDMYGSTYIKDNVIDNGVGEIFESSDSGKTWIVTHDFQRVVMDLAIAPNHPERFYACIANSLDGGIYYSSDYGANWIKLTDPPRTEGHPIEVQVLGDSTIVAVYSARNDNIQFTASSGVFISQDNGQTWIDRSDPGMHYWTMDIEISETNDSIWYASVRSHWGPNNLGQGGIYKTTDRGQNWLRIKDFYRVWSMTLHPSNPDIAYVCTHDGGEGLQYTDNLNSASPTFSRVNSYHFANPNRVIFNPFDENELWVTSFGNGLKKGMTTLLANEQIITENEIKIYPNPATKQITIEFGKIQDKIEITLINQLGQAISCHKSEQTNNYKLELKGASGIYYLRLVLSNGESKTFKIIKD